jgi:peroxiredoxin
MRDLNKIPDGLPIPQDDGACNHLKDTLLPDINLKTTLDRMINLNEITQKPTIIFFYPRTGEPNKPAPADWDLIPGARGCTPQSCGFRDFYLEFQKLGYQVFGLSSQGSDYQKEFVERNHVPFEILSDSNFELTNQLNLPTFTYNGTPLIKRMAWVVVNSKIEQVFYPVFPPNENASVVLKWLNQKT